MVTLASFLALLASSLFFLLLQLVTVAFFYVAFVFVVTTLATVAARDGAAKMVLVFDHLTILGLLLSLQLQQTARAPITVGRVTGTSFLVHWTAIE